MKTPKLLDRIKDHVLAWYWAGKPVRVLYPDPKNYASFNPKTLQTREDDVDILTGDVAFEFLPAVRIFRPFVKDRREVLRHECSHIRYIYATYPAPASEIANEAQRLFQTVEPETARSYADKDDLTPEAVVRLADRMKAGQYMPGMSPGLTRLVRYVSRPSLVWALAYLVVIPVLPIAYILRRFCAR